MERPRVVVLSGSARFARTFDTANLRETMAGHVVLTICPGILDPIHAVRMHRHKIDLADEMLVINCGGYVGPSTQDEIEYAKAQGKKVRFWEETA